MKKREICADFWHRYLRTEYIRCFFFAFSLLTAEYALHAKEHSELPANVCTASDGSFLPAKVIHSSNASVPASNDKEHSKVPIKIDHNSDKVPLREEQPAGLCMTSEDWGDVVAYGKAVVK